MNKKMEAHPNPWLLRPACGLAIASFVFLLGMASPGRSAPPPAPTQSFTNSLGMKFVPVPGTKVLFCVWLTRVRDFEVFVKETGYNPPGGLTNGFSMAKDGWKQRGHSWKNPGFAQTGAHPVCLVNYDDANKFCAWLTRKEFAAGLIKAGQTYRLPTDAEWSQAMGPTKYPWGNKFPPPSGTGNYAGEETKDADWPRDNGIIRGYNDGFARTSPVGSFKANSFGLFDLGGNLWELCDDYFRKGVSSKDRMVRGASWCPDLPAALASSYRYYGVAGDRYAHCGFRCVVVRSSSP
jgi:formylglycine-generating enzyme required for sulfatase activity